MTGIEELRAAAKRLVESVEYDVNGTHGKGGHGGLTSDKTLRAAGELRVVIDRLETAGSEQDWSPPPVHQRPEGYRCAILVEVEWSRDFCGGLGWYRPSAHEGIILTEGAPGVRGFQPLDVTSLEKGHSDA